MSHPLGSLNRLLEALTLLDHAAVLVEGLI